LPQVDLESGIQDKLDLYRTIFAGRSDVYAYRWENAADSTKGWSPRRRPGTTRDNPEHLPLTDDVMTAHLTKDNSVPRRLYVMLADSTCRLLICDFDGGTWRLDAAAYAEAAAWAGVPAAVEISRSGEGAHVWTFFAEPVAAADARAMGPRCCARRWQAAVRWAWRATTDSSRRRTICPSALWEPDRASPGRHMSPERGDAVRRSGDI
jgi:hypothetical protein